jgi:hypothetical protein
MHGTAMKTTFLLCLFNGAVNISGYLASNGRVFSELERILKINSLPLGVKLFFWFV